MSRKTKYFGLVWIFVLATGIGVSLAFLKPVATSRPVAALPSLPTPPVATVAPVTPVAVQVPPLKRVGERSMKKLAAPVFVERANGVYETSTAIYSALLSAGDGLRYLPKAATAKTSELAVRLAHVNRGDETIFDRETDPAADTELAVPRGSGLSYLRTASFTECYEPRINGIEQSFIFDTKPAGEGPLEFKCSVKTKDLTALAPRPGRAGGILFADASGKAAARFGQIMVRDSANKGFVVEPSYDAATATISFAVPAAWVDFAKYPLVVDPVVGDEFLVSFAGSSSESVDQPSVCAGNGNDLVAWLDYTAVTPTLEGAVVSPTIQGNPFAISNQMGQPLPWRFQRMQIAFDGTFWLVVWSDDQPGNAGIHGALVANDLSGSLFGGNDFLIASTTGNVLEDPLVTYNGTNFVIAWSDTPPNQTNGVQIYYSFLTYGFIGNQNQISPGTPQVIPSGSGTTFQVLESLTSQRPGGDVLLIFEDATELPALHQSVRIGTNSVIHDPSGTALFYEDEVLSDGTNGFGVPIGAVFNNNEWQILSSYDQTQDSAIFLHHLSTSGVVTAPNGVFATMGLGPTGFTHAGFTQTSAPAFAGTTEWLFVRTERISNTLVHIIGKRVGFDGTDNDKTPFVIDALGDTPNTRGIQRSAVAAQDGNQFIVAWLDGSTSAAQPGDAVTVNANYVDATATDPNNLLPGLIAVAGASPTEGDPGLTVQFNLDSSVGFGANVNFRWDFGDGSAGETTQTGPMHTYRVAGTYIARLTLTTLGGYSVFDTVVITVGMGGPVQVGMPLSNTPPIVSGLLVTNVLATLDFTNIDDDKVSVAGVFDVTLLPASLVGTVCTISMGTATYTFPLDAKGTFKTDPSSRVQYAFAIAPANGTFVFQLAAENLRTKFEAIGMVHMTEPVKPAKIDYIQFPITLNVSNSKVTLTGSATVGAVYVANVNKTTGAGKGTATYKFNGVGEELAGSFLVTGFTATEGVAKHTYSIKGILVKPGAFKAAVGGNSNFNFYLGEYQINIPGGLIIPKGPTLNYTATKIVSGVKKFTLNTTTGAFLLQMVGIPADDGAGGTGLPLAKSGAGISKVDLNLSFSFDVVDPLGNASTLTAGRYIYIFRANSNAKSWKLR